MRVRFEEFATDYYLAVLLGIGSSDAPLAYWTKVRFIPRMPAIHASEAPRRCAHEYGDRTAPTLRARDAAVDWWILVAHSYLCRQ